MLLNINELSLRYNIKKFTEEDIDDIYRICKENPTYYKYMKIEPAIGNIKNVFTELPPDKTMEDKYFLGFYVEDKLVAILDLITEFPNKDTAFIGWFMMNKAFQGDGIGTEIISDIISYLKESKFSYVRLGYIKGNMQSERFWLKNKFILTGTESETDDYTIVVMQREI